MMSHVVHAVFEMQTKRHFCGHCHQNLSKTVFYKHRTLYFNSRSKEWSKECMFPAGVLNELSFTIPVDELLNAPVALWISWMNQCSFYPMTNVLLKAAATKVNVIGL